MATPIIAFSKDWFEDPTSNHHVLRTLARTRRVLWLSSLSTRTPDLRSSRDVTKLGRKLRDSLRAPVNVENDLWVTTPLVLPFPHAPVAQLCNRQLVRATIASLRRRLGITAFQLWTFLPTTVPYFGVGETLAVYYCVDEWATFAPAARNATLRLEHELLARVDIAFATSRALYDAKRSHAARVLHVPHGVDHAMFAAALTDAVSLPADLAAIPPPRIGFIGTLRDFIDVDMLGAVARARPEWSLVLVGQQLTNLEAVRGLPNVHLLGRKPHDALPAYCKGFDVGLIPYRIDDQVGYINPLKLREYLSAGVPVVSTPMPEVRPYLPPCALATTPAEMVTAIATTLETDSLWLRRERSAAMANESWSARVAELADTTDDLERRKSRARELSGWPLPIPLVGVPINVR